jgi:virginiamycin A acetyltransferase
MIQFLWRQYLRIKNPTCKIEKAVLSKSIELEQNVTIENNCFIGGCKIGKYTFIGMNSYVDKSTESIGRFCSIAMGAKISLNNHPIEWVSTHPFVYKKKYGFVKEDIVIPGVTTKKTRIGNDVWIGANVTILSGVTIGDGAVLGANSVVNQDVEPYSIVAGTPAKHIKYRFDESTIKKLLDLKWWNWTDKEIKGKLPLFSKPAEFK